MAKKPLYILGTGLSHDGSSCILKDGKIAVAIEKERLSRKKHDGGNDRLSVQYCLDALGIGIQDLALIVQVANFEKESIDPAHYQGERVFHADVPVVSISHHLAHAYSALATSPFRETNVLVIDGSGSPALQVDDWPNEHVKAFWCSQTQMHCEKDSFYHFDGQRLHCLHKDFSVVDLTAKIPSAMTFPTNRHSIGGLYAAASNYCFGNMDDAGKLMGLAPYGRDTYTASPLFRMENGTYEVLHAQLECLQQPARNYDQFKEGFQHYADVARWVQKETERAICQVATDRMQLHPCPNLSYAGGVALNAVSNALLLKKGIATQLYLQPAAGDNGLAIGCAYYGWLEVLQQELAVERTNTVFFGRSYSEDPIVHLLTQEKYTAHITWKELENIEETAATLLAEGKVLGWFRGSAEFGPRALGHRSILADPRRLDIQHHINRHIKFREDFRPFAPAVPQEEVARYFKNAWDSPYMILIDEIQEHWKETLPGIVHVDGTCRVQTVDAAWNAEFHALLKAFGQHSGIPILVNTSFNRRGMPIVETPEEALDFFLSCALDGLVLENYLILKHPK